MPFNIEIDKKKYCRIVKITPDTYSDREKIGKRSKRIFGTFARVLHGRGELPEEVKKGELSQLLRLVNKDIIAPILDNPRGIAHSQKQFDELHKGILRKLKRVPITWEKGSGLTGGMAQKIVNLHCKDLWALGLVPERFGRFSHVIIDQVTLNMLGIRVPWTQMESHQDYMNFQIAFRQMARERGTYPLALECNNWNVNRKTRKSNVPR